MSRMTFKESVIAFEGASPWLGPQHAPAVAALRAMAEQLDAELVPAMLSQFGLAYRALEKERPRDVEQDSLAAALAMAGAEE